MDGSIAHEALAVRPSNPAGRPLSERQRARPMKILIYAPNYIPATRYGGPIESSHGLARALARRGLSVDVLTTDEDGPARLDVPIDTPVVIDGVTVRYFPTAMPRRVYRSPSMRAAFERLLPTADVLHINGTYLWPGPTGARIARRHGVPYVHAPRGMLAADLIAGRSRLIKNAWISAFERTALAGAAAIHATAASEAEELRRLGLDLAPIHVIENGVDAPPAFVENDIERLWQSVPRGSRVAMLGRLDWMKGVDLAIRAVATLPHAHLRIGGPDHAGLRGSLEAIARETGADDRISFAGMLRGADKWAFLAGADVVLVPSLRESFGITVVEALRIGTPVLATDGVGASHIVRRIDPACVVPRTPEAFAQALGILLTDRSRRARIGAAGAALMEAEFSWDAVAARMIALYEEITVSSRAKRP